MMLVLCNYTSFPHPEKSILIKLANLCMHIFSKELHLLYGKDIMKWRVFPYNKTLHFFPTKWNHIQIAYLALSECTGNYGECCVCLTMECISLPLNIIQAFVTIQKVQIVIQLHFLCDEKLKLWILCGL